MAQGQEVAAVSPEGGQLPATIQPRCLLIHTSRPTQEASLRGLTLQTGRTTGLPKRRGIPRPQASKWPSWGWNTSHPISCFGATSYPVHKTLTIYTIKNHPLVKFSERSHLLTNFPLFSSTRMYAEALSPTIQVFGTSLVSRKVLGDRRCLINSQPIIGASGASTIRHTFQCWFNTAK